MPRGELIRVDATEGVAQENCIGEAQMLEEGLQIANIVVARVAGGVIGVSVAALVESDDAPSGCQLFGQGSKGYGFHEVRVQGDQHSAFAAGIEIREPQSVVSKSMPFHMRTILLGAVGFDEVFPADFAHLEALAAGQDDEVIGSAVSMNLLNVFDFDDHGAVDTHEFGGVKPGA